MKTKYLFYVTFTLILFFTVFINVTPATCQPSLLVLDLGWNEENNCWYTPEPIYEQEDFIVHVWDANMSTRISNATVIFATHTGEYNITKTDAYGQAFFQAPATNEKIERCILYVSAPGYANTSRYTYIHNQGIWKTVCIATSSTVDVNGRTKLFNVSRYWKLEYKYVAHHDDSALRVIVRRPDGHLLSYYFLRGVERSSGTIYCEGAVEGIQLDIFAGRINSWVIYIYTHG